MKFYVVRASGKHVVASLGSVAASGAYYIAAACEKIVTNPGTITGSIGVIMEFANLRKLYEWAKVDRYVVKSGPYKDIGGEYRPMTSTKKKKSCREWSIMFIRRTSVLVAKGQET